MSEYTTEGNIANSRKSSQLLFFGTLTANNFDSNESPTESIECIRFQQRVVLSEIRIVPNDFRPFKGSRKDHAGQTSPSKFELHLLIHKTLISDPTKLLEKRPPTLPLHPLTISFDETKGYLSYDLTLFPEATTRFIILRGNYHAVTLCVYGRVVETRSSILKSKGQYSNLLNNESQTNKEENEDSSIQNGTDCFPLKQPLSEPRSPSKLVNNRAKTVNNEISGEIKTIAQESEITSTDKNTIKPEKYNRDMTMDGVQKGQTIPFMESTSSDVILVEQKTPEQQTVPMEMDGFYSDEGSRDISDVDRVGVLLKNERPGAFKILNPLNSGNKDILVYHNSPDESLLSHSFFDHEFNKAWEDFSHHLEDLKPLLSTITDENVKYNGNVDERSVVNVMAELLQQITDVVVEGCLWARFRGLEYNDKLDILGKCVLFALDISSGKSSIKLYENGLGLFSKLCACGENFLCSSAVQSCLKLVVPLLNEQHVSSTLQLQILRALLKSMDETKVVECLIGWCDRTHSYDSLYKTYILPMLQVKRLPNRILHLLQAIVRKVSVYEACTLIQQVADNELQNETRKRKKKSDETTHNGNVLKNEIPSEIAQQDINFMMLEDNIQDQDDAELIIEQLSDCLQIISKAALYHMALGSNEDVNQDNYSIFSFQYLTFCRLFPAITIILTSQKLRNCSRFHEFVNSLGRLCVVLLGEQAGMLYLAKQLQQLRDPFCDSLLAIWANLLCYQSDVTDSPEEAEDTDQTSMQIINERWSDVNEIRKTPGIGDIWCGLGQSTTGGNYDEDYDYICDNEDDCFVKNNHEEDSYLKKARQILKMKSYGAMGSESDCLDNFAIPSDQLVILLVYHVNSIAIVEKLLEIGRHGSENPNYDHYQRVITLLSDLFEMTTFNVGKQAVVSTLIHLDALPTIISYLNLNPSQEGASPPDPNSISSAISRVSLELLEAVVKFFPAFPYLLSSNIHELLPSFTSQENNLRILWDPIVVFHETGNIQGVIDIIKHQKYYPECLRDHSAVNQILVALRLLLSYTYLEDGILQILKARMDDYSGLDNGDSFFVFLLRLLNHAAEVLSDMNDFVVYTDHQTTSDLTSNIDDNNHLAQDEFRIQDAIKFSGNSIEINKNDHPQNSTFASSSGVFLSSEIIDLRKELLDLVWFNLILIRRFLKVVYGDLNSNVAKRHFKNIYGKEEFPDDPLPSQKKSMTRSCIESWLAIIVALDHLDGRLSDQLGAVALLGNDHPVKSGQSAQIARVRALLLNMFGLLTQVIIEEKDSTRSELQYRSRLFSNFSGRHVVKYLIDFIFDAPNNFLSGLHILSEILPTPLTTYHRLHGSNVQKNDSSPIGNDNYFDTCEPSTSLSDSHPESQMLRDYWINQLIPLRDDLMQLVKCLSPASSKVIHVMLRTVICQLVDLDVHDRGIGRGMAKILINGVHETLVELQLTLDKVDNRRTNSSNSDEPEKNMESIDENSVEFGAKLSLLGRWLSMLISLGGNSLGRALLLDSLSGTNETILLAEKKTSDIQRGLIPMLLSLINASSDLGFIYDLIAEFFFSICNHTISVPGSNMPGIEDLGLIIETLLNCVKQGKNGRLQVQSLLILQKIAETEIGALIILTNQEHCQLISNMITWVPEILSSSDLVMQDLNIAYNSIVFILRIITYVPCDHKSHDGPAEVDIKGHKSLSLLINAHDSPEILLKTYESVGQQVLEFSYERNENDEIIYDLNMCRSIANVIQSFIQHLNSNILMSNRSNDVTSQEEIKQEFKMRLDKVLENRSLDIHQDYSGSKSMGSTIDDYPEIPFYDVIDDPAGKEVDGGLFNEPNIEIDFEVFAKEMLPNFQFQKKMKMSGDNATKGRKLKSRTVSNLGGVAYESNARRNLGGGKTYQKNEFRSIHNNRKANTSRPPSVHVDDFMSGKIPVNQQHPDMLNTSSLPTTNSTPNKRGGITTVVGSQITASNRGGRGRRSSTSSVVTSRGASRGASSSGRGAGGIGRGGNTNTNIMGAWEMGNNTPWTGGPPSLPVIIAPPISKYMEFDRQRDYTRYDGQTMRTGYYDNQYYGMPSPIAPPYDRPPVQQSAPGVGPRIKGAGDNRGRTVPQEWPRSMVSQPTRRPERPFAFTDPNQRVAVISNQIEKDSATAIEDRSQDGVSKCIATLKYAGIKIWILTKDKIETGLALVSLPESRRILRLTRTTFIYPTTPRTPLLQQYLSFPISPKTLSLTPPEAIYHHKNFDDSPALYLKTKNSRPLNEQDSMGREMDDTLKYYYDSETEDSPNDIAKPVYSAEAFPVKSNYDYVTWGSDHQVFVSKKEIEDIFIDLANKIGFQKESMCNMYNHLMYMLDSRALRMPSSQALLTLHADYIGGENANYRKWYFATHMDMNDDLANARSKKYTPDLKEDNLKEKWNQ
ncbi:18868_t:CDS:10 [Acaulospora morrowiae]|uniref:18868_t:CDS:1 n=1 Tax=Acaulospora morrowiae TaxID=94023 RepID=A0A9N8V4T4_9GLOM|nr:18868_t:CDS:10 [Acaulospora morrowiae]